MGASIAGGLRGAVVQGSALTLACGGLHGTEAGRRGVEAMLARAETLGPGRLCRGTGRGDLSPRLGGGEPRAVEDFRTGAPR
jgi:hypothetical protein